MGFSIQRLKVLGFEFLCFLGLGVFVVEGLWDDTKGPISPNESRRKPRAHARQMQTPIVVLSRT